LTGDVFGSARCDCGYQLSKSLDLISEQGGIFIYLRQEGRGIGLANKIKAYSLQSKGLDTVQANTELGFLSDQREYGVAAQILKALGVAQVKMLTNNPQKIAGLTESGIVVSERIALETEPSAKNSHYLKTKRDKLGHLLKA
jgi:3,4-dihydroxy 2-butanone 4-phosphate synthase/GTP cyclohydrolase II